MSVTTTPTGPAEPGPAPVLPALRLRLPGSWWQVPLHDRTEARAAVRRLVAAQTGHADALAGTRIELERRLLDMLDGAIAGDGQAFHVALSIVPGVVLPVTALVSLPAEGLTPAIGTSADATMSVLERGLAGITEGGAAGLHRFTAGPSEVARRVRQKILSSPDGTDHAPGFVAEYWMTVPGTKRFLLASFSGPAGALEEPLVGLFDQIVRVSRWETPAA